VGGSRGRDRGTFPSVTEETIRPTSEGTRPIERAEGPPPREDTETLPGAKPDLPAVALLGSVAYRGSRMRKRIGSTLGPLWGRGWNRVALAAVLGVLVVLLGVSLVDGGPEVTQVPDVRGRPYREAATLLQQRGLTSDRVSFAPADEDRAGLVIEIIPAPGTRVEGGSTVHLVAGAVTTTPAPAPTPRTVVSDEAPREAKDEDKGKGRRGRDDDDD
jgi:hypothetical protein